MLIAFGIFPYFIGGKEQQERISQATALVNHGSPTKARVIQKSEPVGNVKLYTFEYAYEVDGQTFEDFAEVDQATWARLKVGDLTRVLYLREQPNVSQPNPRLWLENNKRIDLFGLFFVLIGIAVMGVTAHLDRKRHRTGIEFNVVTTSEGQTIYRNNPAFYILGGLFFCAGVVAQISMLSMLLSGRNFPVTHTVNGVSTTYMAGPTEKMLWTLFPIPFWGIGLGVILCIKNFRITIGLDHVSVRTQTGHCWIAPRAEAQVTSKWGNGARLKAGENSVWIPASTPGYRDLITTLERRD